MILLFTNSAFVPCTVLTCEVIVHALEKQKKKKEKKTWVWKRGFSHVMLLFMNNAFVLCIVLTFDVTVHALEKKKKKKQNKTKQNKKNANVDLEMRIQTHTGAKGTIAHCSHI